MLQYVFAQRFNYYNKRVHDAMRTCRGSEGFPTSGGNRLTAEGVNPSSRSVFEKSVRVNCFLHCIRQRDYTQKMRKV